ncbi:MAG TPA: hypothetical protein DEB36_11345, partial [Porphyromonadaceae bacterium]|nr:hypothetical protein [Porphyromonadaceae bacterium]
MIKDKTTYIQIDINTRGEILFFLKSCFKHSLKFIIFAVYSILRKLNGQLYIYAKIIKSMSLEIRQVKDKD